MSAAVCPFVCLVPVANSTTKKTHKNQNSRERSPACANFQFKKWIRQTAAQHVDTALARPIDVFSSSRNVIPTSTPDGRRVGKRRLVQHGPSVRRLRRRRITRTSVHWVIISTVAMTTSNVSSSSSSIPGQQRHVHLTPRQNHHLGYPRNTVPVCR